MALVLAKQAYTRLAAVKKSLDDQKAAQSIGQTRSVIESADFKVLTGKCMSMSDTVNCEVELVRSYLEKFGRQVSQRGASGYIGQMLEHELTDVFNVKADEKQFKALIESHVQAAISRRRCVDPVGSLRFALELRDCADLDMFFSSYVTKGLPLKDNSVFKNRLKLTEESLLIALESK